MYRMRFAVFVKNKYYKQNLERKRDGKLIFSVPLCVYITTKSGFFQDCQSLDLCSIIISSHMREAVFQVVLYDLKEGVFVEEKFAHCNGEDAEQSFLALFSEKNQLQKVMETNKKTEQFGLELSQEDAKLLVEARGEELRTQKRVEFGEGILPKIIFAFCDSSYLSQDNYVETVVRLQEIFYLFKNESMDLLTDDELLEFMREQYEQTCFGDLDYLESTCLESFAREVRADYRTYWRQGSKGDRNEY